MSIFKKIFQKSESNPNPPIIDLETLDKAYHYVLQEEDSQIAIKVDGIKNPVQFVFLEIPGSFDNEDNRVEMAACHINSPFDLFNTFLQKIGMELIPLDQINDDLAYNFLWIYYETKTRVGESIQKTNHNFFIEPFHENEKAIDFGMTYSCSDSENFVERFLEAKYINHKNPKSKTDLEVINQLKMVLDELGEHANADFMFILNREPRLESNVTEDDFKTLLQLISRNQITKIDLENCSKHLYQISKKEIKPEFNITNTTFDLVSELGFSVFWDYKFDASNLKFVIEELSKKEFNYESPSTIFGTDLFPFAQKQLAILDLELMELKSYADNYFFILVNKKDVAEILEVSKITNIEIGKLN